MSFRWALKNPLDRPHERQLKMKVRASRRFIAPHEHTMKINQLRLMNILIVARLLAYSFKTDGPLLAPSRNQLIRVHPQRLNPPFSGHTKPVNLKGLFQESSHSITPATPGNLKRSGKLTRVLALVIQYWLSGSDFFACSVLHD